MLDILKSLNAQFDEVSYQEFYRDIFPIGSFEEKGVYENGKYNGIAVSVGHGENETKRYTVTDELGVLDKLAATDDFCLMSPISYVGKSRKSENARFMYALAIDLDGVETDKQWDFFMEQIDRGHEMLSFVWGLPRPTYLVSSGTGIHIYYVFEKPVPMFRDIVKQLEVLKKRLTWQAWTQGASSLHDNVQYESLFQGFRIVGTITKTGGRCRAFKTGDKVTVEYLNRFVPKEYRTKGFIYKSDLRLSEAKEKYPEWYQRRVVENRPRGTWTCKKALYDWWIEKLSGGAEQGHRYWCIMTLATYAKKCGVPKETLEKDAYGLIPLMNTKGDKFTEDDVLHALEAFSDSYITYPIDTIVNRTGIPIEKNKRNGRKQAVHVKYMNNQRAFKVEMGECTNGGRPKGSGTAEQKVRDWRRQHPEGRKADCIRDTGLDKKTVYKWWDTPAAPLEQERSEQLKEKREEKREEALLYNERYVKTVREIEGKLVQVIEAIKNYNRRNPSPPPKHGFWQKWKKKQPDMDKEKPVYKSRYDSMTLKVLQTEKENLEGDLIHEHRVYNIEFPLRFPNCLDLMKSGESHFKNSGFIKFLQEL